MLIEVLVLFCILLEGILLVVGLAVHVDEVAGGGDASVQVLLRFGAIRRVRQRDLEKENKKILKDLEVDARLSDLQNK